MIGDTYFNGKKPRANFSDRGIALPRLNHIITWSIFPRTNIKHWIKPEAECQRFY